MRDIMATNKVYCSYQEIIDLHTEPEKVTAIGIHTPTDDTPYKMFEGFFKQFKKYKYVGASVSLVPVATLPVDPLQVDYVGNEGIDPRDVMNPILFHGCHGEDMGTVLNMLIGRDAAISDSLIGMQGNNADGAPTSEMLLYSLLDELYYKALTDRTWRKAHPQRGFKKSGLRPLLYTLATNRQVAPGSLSDVLGFNDEDDVTAFGGDPTIADRIIINPVTGEEITVPTYATKNNMQLMTPRLTRLGYLDTRNLVTDFTPGVATVDTMVTSENWTRLPKLMMGLILLPPSYKVEMHFRMIVNHYWTFKGFRGISFRNDLLKSPSYFNANEDLFANESGNGNPIPEEIDPDSGGDTPTPGGSDAHQVKVFLRVSDEVKTDLLANTNYKIDFHLEVNRIDDENEWYRYEDIYLKRYNTQEIGVTVDNAAVVRYDTWVSDGNYSPVLATPDYYVNFSTPVASGGLSGTYGWSPSVGQVTDNPNQEITFTLVKVTS